MTSKILRTLTSLSLGALLIVGCAPEKHKHKQHKTAAVYPYKQTVTPNSSSGSNSGSTSSSANDFIYWYIIYSSITNNVGSCPCYTYSSPTPVTNFSSVQFTKTETPPPELTGDGGSAGTIVPEPVQEVPTEELGTEMQTDINENFDTNDSQESGAVEEGFDESGSGSSNSGSGAEESNDNSSGSDNSSSDGGSSDGGGGDGGGGDGGGGGD